MEYEDTLKAYRDWFSVMKTAESKGEAKGRAEGRAEGEYVKAVEIARNLKNCGVDTATISNPPAFQQKRLRDCNSQSVDNITRGALHWDVHLLLVLYLSSALQTRRDWRVMYSPIQTVQFLFGVLMHIYQMLLLKAQEAVGMVTDRVVGRIEKENPYERNFLQFPFPTFAFQRHQVK